MKIARVSIRNFRSLGTFTLPLDGSSAFLIGENSVGKSSVLTCIARALSRDLKFEPTDFQSTAAPIEIELLLTDLDQGQRGVFCDVMTFNNPPTLMVGVRAVWDSDSEEIEVVHGYSQHGWRKSSRDERNALYVQWISDTRGADRLLQFGYRRSLIGELLSDVDLDQRIGDTIQSIKDAGDSLANADELNDLLRASSADMAKLLPNVAPDAFGVSATASTDSAILRQLQLTLAYESGALPVRDQSSGLAQLSLFVFSLQLLKKNPGAILLVDEPELSLHPQSQRSLVTLITSLANQCIIATHSASVLDRVDPRRIVRLYRAGTAVESARPTALLEAEAKKLARFTNPHVAEAFFARSAILVEGLSDKFAIEALAQRTGRNLDAEGISIVALDGGGSIRTFLAMLGPAGLKVKLAGLCDADHEPAWKNALEAAGMGAGLDRAQMERIGFFVCDRDLEDVLINALGVAAVVQIINQQGESATFTLFCQQPTHFSQTRTVQLRVFFATNGRKIRYAPLMVDQLTPAAIPAPLSGVLSSV